MNDSLLSSGRPDNWQGPILPAQGASKEQSGIAAGAVQFRRRKTVNMLGIASPTSPIGSSGPRSSVSSSTSNAVDPGVALKKRRQSVAVEQNFDIVQLLQKGDGIEKVKSRFNKCREGVKREEFVSILKETLHLSGGAALNEVEKLFDYVDAKSEGVITWDDFTTYCVDSAILTKISTELAENLTRWELEPDVYTCASHRPWKIKAISNSASGGDFFVVDASSSIFAINPNLEAVKVPIVTSGSIIDAEYVPFQDIFCVATAASELVVVDSACTMIESIKVPTSIQCMTWNKPTQVLCTGDRSGLLACWMIERTPTDKLRLPQLRRSWQIRDAPIFTLAIHRTLGTIVAGFLDGTVVVVHPVTGRRERTFSVGNSGLNALAISEHQNSVLVGGTEPVPKVWTLTNCEESKPFSLTDRTTPHGGPIVSIVTIPDSAQALTLDFTGVLKAWDLRTFSCQQSFSCRMRDPKVCWNSLCVSADSMTIIACDRKNLLRLKQVDDEEQHAAKGTIIGVGCSVIAGRILSINLNSVRLWNDLTGTLVGEVTLATREEVTCALVDENGGRLFIGNNKGAVYVYNASTAGLIARFSKAHTTEVVAITFLTHANMAISCSDDGSGSILKPPSVGAQNDALFSRVQPGFRCMPGRLCLYVGGESQVILAADEELRVNMYDCRNVKSTGVIVNQATLDFGPKIERMSRDDRTQAQVVASGGTKRRFFSCGVAFHEYGCAVVADSNTLALLHLAPIRMGGPSKIMRWALDVKYDGPAVTAMVVLPTTNSSIHERRNSNPIQAQLAVCDDGGRVTIFDLGELIEHRVFGGSTTVGPVGVSRRQLRFGPITSVALHQGLNRLAFGFNDAIIGVYTLSCRRVWDSVIRTKTELADLIALEAQDELEEASRNSGFLPDVIEGGDVPGGGDGKNTRRRSGRPLGETRIVSFTALAKGVAEANVPSGFKGKKGTATKDDPVWVRQQLTTLCGEEERQTYTMKKVERPAFVTPNRRIPVFIDLDHTAVCIPVDEDKEKDEGYDQRKANDSSHLTDRRAQKQKEEMMREQHQLPSYVNVKRFIGRPTNEFPPLSVTQPVLAEALPPTCLLRPLRRANPGSGMTEEIRASTPGPNSTGARVPLRVSTPSLSEHQGQISRSGPASRLRGGNGHGTSAIRLLRESAIL
jgi:hypothetical protein